MELRINNELLGYGSSTCFLIASWSRDVLGTVRFLTLVSRICLSEIRVAGRLVVRAVCGKVSTKLLKVSSGSIESHFIWVETRWSLWRHATAHSTDYLADSY